MLFSKSLRSISETLLEARDCTVQPAGLFCLDILRMEAGLPRVGADVPVGLYTPIRAALAWTLDQSKMRNLGVGLNFPTWGGGQLGLGWGGGLGPGFVKAPTRC